MQRKTCLLTLLALCSLFAHAQVNPNFGFESGNFSNWIGGTGAMGSSMAGSTYSTTGGCCPIYTPAPGIVSNRQTIMNSSMGSDPYTGVPVVYPGGGNYSCRLGNDSTGGEAESLEYHFLVDPANPFLNYHFAIVMQDPGHFYSNQPHFNVFVYDSIGNQIACGALIVIPGSPANAFPWIQVNSTNVTGVPIDWSDWQSVTLDLSAYAGHHMSVYFGSGDCSQGSHFGYAYIDITPHPVVNQVLFCQGASSFQLQAPSGYHHYHWSTGDTTQALQIANPQNDDTFSVQLTLAGTGPCNTTQQTYVLKMATAVQAAFQEHLEGCGLHAQFQDLSAVLPGPGSPTAWHWDFGDTATHDTSALSHPSYTYPAPGNYTVTLIASLDGTCADTVTQLITIPDSLTVTIAQSYDNCSRLGTMTALPSGGSPPYGYSWTGTTATTALATQLNPGFYAVTVTDVAGCSKHATQNLVAVIPSTPVPQITLHGDTLTCNISSDIQWYRYGLPLAGDTSQNLILTQSGCYQVSYTDTAGCALSDSFCVTMTGIQQFSGGNNIQFYPNPVSGLFTVRTAPGWVGRGNELVLYDGLGRLRCTIPINANILTINAITWTRGIYFYQVKQQGEVLDQGKLIIQ